MNLLGRDFDRIASIYSVANTPAYVYYKFREDGKIQALSNQYSSSELSGVIKGVLEKQTLDLESITNAYAALIALTLKKDWFEIKNGFSETGINRLKWAGYLVEMANALSTPTTFENAKFIKPIFSNNHVVAKSPVTTTNFSLENK